MNAADNLFQSLRDYGWPILAYLIFAPIPTYLIPTGRTTEEKTARLLLAGVILAGIEAAFFIGTESSDFIHVAKDHPAWGVYVFLLGCIAILVLTIEGIKRHKQNRELYEFRINSQYSDNDEIDRGNRWSVKVVILSGIVWSTAMIGALYWLSTFRTT